MSTAEAPSAPSGRICEKLPLNHKFIGMQQYPTNDILCSFLSVNFISVYANK